MFCLFLCCLFCFFKQKTAYEMRISDWSSDVCSSDLFVGEHCPRALYMKETIDRIIQRPMPRNLDDSGLPVEHRRTIRLKVVQHGAVILETFLFQKFEHVMAGLAGGRPITFWTNAHYPVQGLQIGRASCRERVCQSV